VSNDGKVAAIVVGVGGFLGIGEREVALSFPSVRIESDNSATAMVASVIVKADLTKDTLGNARAWNWPGRSGASPAPPANPTAK